MKPFAVRALEIHSDYAWNFGWVKKAIAFVEEHDLNTLILHRNDIVDRIVYPAEYFGASKEHYQNIHERYRDIFRNLYRYTPTRRSGPIVRRDYIKRVVHEAKRRGIEVYLENKELAFPDILLEIRPELTKDGHICPNEPFWWEFINEKYRELFADIPDLAGIITSPGTGESRISISANRCTCALCQTVSPAEWYRGLIMAMYRPVSEAGKRLIVRDFVFDSATQKDLSAAFEGLPADVVAAIKNTPHDYYPTFPHNPLIGNVGEREQWIEFDTMAQYYGWGIGPSTMVNDFRERVDYARRKGATGVMLRTDWENLDGHTAFDTFNYVNLYAGAMLAHDPAVENGKVYERWLEDNSCFSPSASSKQRTDSVEWIASIFDQNWEVVRNTLYMNDCVFSDSSMIPVGVEHARWLAEEKNSLKDWVPEKASALSVSESNLRGIIASRDAALARVAELRRIVEGGNHGLTDQFVDLLKERYRIFELYAKGFAEVGRAFILSLGLSDAGKLQDAYRTEVEQQLLKSVRSLEEIAQEYDELFKTSSYQHTVYILLNSERLRSFRSDVVDYVGWHGKSEMSAREKHQ